MPKVEYTTTKGLVQTSGTGFSVDAAAIQPSLESKSRQLITVADIAKTGAQINGLYFICYNSSAQVVIWFSSSDNAAPATQPSAGSGGAITYVKITVVDADADTVVISKMETQLEAASVGLVANDAAADGSCLIEGDLPYATAGTASAGTLGTAVTQTTVGAGLSTLACQGFGVTNITEDISSMETAQVYTLPAGAYAGVTKTIIRSSQDDVAVTLTCNGYVVNDTGRGARTFTFGNNTDTTAKSLFLCWDGDGWIIVKMCAGVTVA